MNRIIKILSLCLILCIVVNCSPKQIQDMDNIPTDNETTDNFDNQDNNESQEPVLSGIWTTNNIPTKFDELKPFLLDGCWAYIQKDYYKNYYIVDIITFSDFPVMVDNEYFQLDNDNFIYANVLSTVYLDEELIDRYSDYLSTNYYPDLPIKDYVTFFDDNYYLKHFTFENNESVDDENINICFTRYYDMEWYLTMDNFDIKNREIHFSGETHYHTTNGNGMDTPNNPVVEIEDNECTFKHFTSIEDAKEYIYKEYIEPMKPIS